MKPIWQSKTAILSIVAIVVGAVAGITTVVTGHEVLGIEEPTAIASAVAGVVFFLLRIITKEPVSLL